MAANETVGFATYQQQDTSGRPAIASIILFFSAVVIIIISFIFYFWITRWHKIPAQQRREEELEDQKEIDQLVENLKDQVKTVFRIPIVRLLFVKKHPASHEHRKVLAYKLYHLFSLTCLLVTLVSLVVLIGTASSSGSSSLLQTFLFVFVLSVNLYLITRQRCYYKERKELFGNSDAHMNAVYKTRFTDWNTKLWTNWVQIAILIIEFFQLLAFPLRDLITVNLFSGNGNDNFFNLVTIVMNAGGFMPDMRTPVWYTYSVWTVFATAMLSLLIAVTVHCINMWQPYKIPTRWVHWCIPVTTLLYIPVLTTFVSSAACQTLNVPTNDFASTLRCHAPDISQQIYLWTSLVGYIVAYFLLTIFLTSYERIPEHDEIAFKSISVAFIKNMGLFLAIVYLLVETTSDRNRMRAILSIMILLTMICYNIKTRPCYVDKINYFRTTSFSCILWTSVLVAVLSDTNAAETLGPLTVLCIIVGGWGLIVVLFLLIYFTYYKQPSEYCDDEGPVTPAGFDPKGKWPVETDLGNMRRSTDPWTNNARLETVVEENGTWSNPGSRNPTPQNHDEGVFDWATRWWSAKR
ncbi:hypothetical protein BJV82DRAFT_615628 [Fennellomyces sp. T-0311]|nr:hypothetical protein BJV82DRAFT_615628 [Fennellomyces sp. T-0311]